MARNRRDKEVALSKVKKKTRENKSGTIEKIQKSLEEYKNIYVFNIDSMRAQKMTEIRKQLKDSSRIFFAGNGLMRVAFGKDKASEKAPGLHKITNVLKGQCGLIFTNLDDSTVKKLLNDFVDTDYARAGQVVDETITLEAGLLPQFPFSVEPQLRKLGLPVKLEKGEIHLIKDFPVCSEGDKLNPEQAKILKLLGHKLAEFRVKLLARWSEKDGFKLLS
uniref:Ribosome assembly factor mrt4 n=1 Tax=Panagrolaimus sp. JU765 TaxID=591449 RepID=A0AC34QLK5_9BILA